MQFSVIYSVDVPSEINLDDYAPPHVAVLWDETQGDDHYEYSYLEGRWQEGHHRQWGAILTRAEFDEFVEHCGLKAEDVRTLGSIGAPGCGVGSAPAISFTSNEEDAIQSAYVTPLPETTKDHGDERDWERVRTAVLAVYG
jgi:hypothetical protein